MVIILIFKDAVPDELKYQLCGNEAFVMALVYKACCEGYYKFLYKIGDEWVPAMIIMPGKKLSEEEMKNPDLICKE